LVQGGVDAPSSRWSAALAARHPNVLAAVALHPNEAGAGKATDTALAEIDRLGGNPRGGAAGGGGGGGAAAAPGPRGGRRRRRASGHTSGSPRSTVSRSSSTTARRIRRSSTCSR